MKNKYASHICTSFMSILNLFSQEQIIITSILCQIGATDRVRQTALLNAKEGIQCGGDFIIWDEIDQKSKDNLEIQEQSKNTIIQRKVKNNNNVKNMQNQELNNIESFEKEKQFLLSQLKQKQRQIEKLQEGEDQNINEQDQSHFYIEEFENSKQRGHYMEQKIQIQMNQSHELMNRIQAKQTERRHLTIQSRVMMGQMIEFQVVSREIQFELELEQQNLSNSESEDENTDEKDAGKEKDQQKKKSKVKDKKKEKDHLEKKQQHNESQNEIHRSRSFLQVKQKVKQKRKYTSIPPQVIIQDEHVQRKEKLKENLKEKDKNNQKMKDNQKVKEKDDQKIKEKDNKKVKLEVKLEKKLQKKLEMKLDKDEIKTEQIEQSEEIIPLKPRLLGLVFEKRVYRVSNVFINSENSRRFGFIPVGDELLNNIPVPGKNFRAITYDEKGGTIRIGWQEVFRWIPETDENRKITFELNLCSDVQNTIRLFFGAEESPIVFVNVPKQLKIYVAHDNLPRTKYDHKIFEIKKPTKEKDDDYAKIFDYEMIIQQQQQSQQLQKDIKQQKEQNMKENENQKEKEEQNQIKQRKEEEKVEQIIQLKTKLLKFVFEKGIYRVNNQYFGSENSRRFGFIPVGDELLNNIPVPGKNFRAITYDEKEGSIRLGWQELIRWIPTNKEHRITFEIDLREGIPQNTIRIFHEYNESPILFINVPKQLKAYFAYDGNPITTYKYSIFNVENPFSEKKDSYMKIIDCNIENSNQN